VKLQLCTLATKLLILAPEHQTLILLSQYVFSLARYDSDYDVRDRARMLGMLLHGVSPDFRLMNGSTEDVGEVIDKGGVVLRREQVRLVLFEGKLQAPDEKISGRLFQSFCLASSSQLSSYLVGESDVLGSLEAVTGRPMSLASSRRLPDWPDEGTDSSLRDAEEEYPVAPITSIAGRTVGFGSSKFASPASRTPVGGPSPQGSFYNNKDNDANNTITKATWKDLDKFYEDDVGGEDESEEEDEREEDDIGTTEGKLHEGKEIEGESDEEEDSSSESE